MHRSPPLLLASALLLLAACGSASGTPPSSDGSVSADASRDAPLPQDAPIAQDAPAAASLVGQWFARITSEMTDNQTVTMTLHADQRVEFVHSQRISVNSGDHRECTEQTRETGRYMVNRSVSPNTLSFVRNNDRTGQYLRCPNESENGASTTQYSPLLPADPTVFTLEGDTLVLGAPPSDTTFRRQ